MTFAVVNLFDYRPIKLVLSVAALVLYFAQFTFAEDAKVPPAKAAVAAPNSDTADNSGTVESERVVYDFSRLHSFDDERLPAALIIAGAIALVAVVWQLYRRDAVELTRGTRLGVMLLRCLALAGLIVFFLGIERRTTREVVHNSQVAVLVDVSQSMGLSENENSADVGGSRIKSVVEALEKSPLIAELRLSHDVNVTRFDQEVEPIVTFPKQQEPKDKSLETEVSTKTDSESPALDSVDWTKELQPRGIQTRLGQALGDELRLYHDAPLAGVVVITDGAQNAGIEPGAAVEVAHQAKVPLYTIGVGSAASQRNVAIRDLVVPTRAFPNDTLNITGYLQAVGYPGQTVDVDLTRRRTQDPAGSGASIASQRVTLGADGEMVPVSFDTEPGAPGTFVFQLQVKAPADDGNPRDNAREAEIEIVDRKTKVLLFASGPMRDYQFLRNQLHRDSTMITDVYLQTAQPGISQDANKILDHFPSTPDELYQYDCIVAFDPDWTKLDAAQVALVEKWVSEEAGGLIATAGPIETPKWIRSTEHAKLRDLYPVIFQNRLTLMDDNQAGGETPWPLAFERAGREAKFLWLGKNAEDSEAAWDSFPGVFGYFAVKGEKPGATVYARFSNPQTGTAAQRPVYLASQFYGAGQVFYIGGGEFWRLRRIDPAYFEVLYTKLIRHVSQGRILRGSSRGALLVERDRYELGETVVVRARLSDPQHKPLTTETVTAQLLRPDGSAEPVKLTAETERPGMYLGQATVLQEGTYQLALSLPGGTEEPLTRYLQVRVPDLERTHAERNDTLLASIAKETGGIYYKQLGEAIHGEGSNPPISQAIKSRAEVKLIKGAPDKQFAKSQMQWLLVLIAGSLFLEWIIRRVNRLA
ncbi:MAG TPA: vWA domain-containing protein [Lacipirellulaceae bacterium]|nr:vWA domain-containing protein [Lacipirellulaceae bacterium]